MEKKSGKITSSDTARSSASSTKDIQTYIRDNSDSRPLLLNYLGRLWVKYNLLRLSVLTNLPPEGINLASIYVALNTDTVFNISRAEDSATEFVPSDGSYLSRRITTEASLLSKFRSYTRPATALEMLEYYPRLVLIGPPGSGKSTFLQYLTLCMAGEILEKTEANLTTLNGAHPPEVLRPWPHGAMLPLLIELRTFVRSDYFPRDGMSGTSKHLMDYVDSTLLSGRDPDIRSLIQQSTEMILLMLDGLDEVPEADQSRQRLREVISDFVRSYPSCRVVVTSRPYAYRDPTWRLDDVGFSETLITELSEPQIKEFVLHWYKCLEQQGQVDEGVGEQRASYLYDAILQKQYLKQLASNPLLLTMVAAVNERTGGTLPINRALLYEENVTLLFDRWNQQRAISAPAVSETLNTTKDDLRKSLNRLAFEVHNTSGAKYESADISLSDLREALSGAFRNETPETNLKIDGIMDYLHQRSGILVAESPDAFRFPHRSFQEYLAACHLISRDDYPDFAAKIAVQEPTIWRDVLLYIAWRAITFREKDAWDLIAELCAYPVPKDVDQFTDWWGALLAGSVLIETDIYKHDMSRRYRTVLKRVREWLVACIERKIMSTLDRAEIGRILGYIRDPRPGIRVNAEGVPDIQWIAIPAGVFLMGSTDEDEFAFANEKPQRKIDLKAFWISKYPITVSQFRSYLDSEEFTIQQRDEIKGNWNKQAEYFLDNYPITDVDFATSTKFCEWLSGKLKYKIRLPSEEEWEKAARGSDGRIFPWGKKFDENKCNVQNIGRPCAVGLFPEGESPYGVMDMSGNVWEWTSSQWRAEYGVPAAGYSNEYTIRGGAYGVAPENARCAHRSPEGTALLAGQGFRVVTSEDPRK